MKRFLLTAGDNYYPSAGVDDWIGIFETREQAEALVTTKQQHEYYTKGPRKGQIRETHTINFVNGKQVDWYEIIDLQNWQASKRW